MDLNTLTLPSLHAYLRATGLPRRLFELARDEDAGSWTDLPGDRTSLACFPEDATLEASVRARAACVVAGLAWIPELIEVIAPGVIFEPAAGDGEQVLAGRTLGVLRGSRLGVLALERPLLNLLSRSCGIASLARRYVEEVAGTGARIFDTRKTTPGLRVIEKYAVRCGGAMSHRLGLFDAVLIKDNHIAGVPLKELGRHVSEAAARARGRGALCFVQVEVDTLEQLAEILRAWRDGPARIDSILLDNMSVERLKEAAALRDKAALPVTLEASGGVRLSTVRSLALAGVERISVGELTWGAPAVDIGLDVGLDIGPDAQRSRA